MMEATDPHRILRLVGVYNAEGTLRGELTYWVGARLGRAHCALCVITHGAVRERSDWRQCRDGLPVPFITFHRDDQPTVVRDLLGEQIPAVVAVTGTEHVLLLGPDALESCDGSPVALVEALTTAAASAGLMWS